MCRTVDCDKFKEFKNSELYNLINERLSKYNNLSSFLEFKVEEKLDLSTIKEYFEGEIGYPCEIINDKKIKIKISS